MCLTFSWYIYLPTYPPIPSWRPQLAAVYNFPHEDGWHHLRFWNVTYFDNWERILSSSYPIPKYTEYFARTLIMPINNNKNNRFTAFVRDYPDEPVPEETLTHPPSWSSSNLYQLRKEQMYNAGTMWNPTRPRATWHTLGFLWTFSGQ